MPDHHPAPPQAPSVGALVELSRYRVATGERIVRGQRILGVVRVTDAPADGQGRTYVVERGLTSKAELAGVVGHYVEQARRWEDIPLLHLYPDTNEVAR
jgi:hypothetical protein